MRRYSTKFVGFFTLKSKVPTSLDVSQTTFCSVHCGRCRQKPGRPTPQLEALRSLQEYTWKLVHLSIFSHRPAPRFVILKKRTSKCSNVQDTCVTHTRDKKFGLDRSTVSISAVAETIVVFCGGCPPIFEKILREDEDSALVIFQEAGLLLSLATLFRPPVSAFLFPFISRPTYPTPSISLTCSTLGHPNLVASATRLVSRPL